MTKTKFFVDLMVAPYMLYEMQSGTLSNFRAQPVIRTRADQSEEVLALAWVGSVVPSKTKQAFHSDGI